MAVFLVVSMVGFVITGSTRPIVAVLTNLVDI